MLLFTCVLSCVIEGLLSAEVRLIDLEPTDAQQIIERQDQSLNYAPKIDTNVPAVRFLGNEPHHVLEDIYLARQYHGQDGVGGYLYGYNIPDIAKTEKKKAGGDLTGAYNYINGDGKEIKVQYWDDGTGFHQIDNVPQIAPKQVDDSPEVKAAKEKFLARWHEEAERNSHPLPNPYDAHQVYTQQTSQYPQLRQYSQYQQQQQQQPGYQQYYQPNQVDYSGQSSDKRDVYAPAQNRQQDEEEDTTGPPKGFFYSFDYPVGIIVQKEGLVRKEGDLRSAYPAAQK